VTGIKKAAALTAFIVDDDREIRETKRKRCRSTRLNPLDAAYAAI
jgi:hypothetical protein